MLSVLLPPSLVGLLAGAVLCLSTLAAFLLFTPFIAVKLLVPLPGVRRACTGAC